MTTLFSEAALEFSRNAKARLDDDGFFHLEEISIRPLLSEMEKIGFSRAWGTPLALDFFTCILGDEVSYRGLSTQKPSLDYANATTARQSDHG